MRLYRRKAADMNMLSHHDLTRALERLSPAKVLVHSDLVRGYPIPFVKGQKEKFIADHYDALLHVLGAVDVYMPAFNYQFFTDRRFDVQHSPSEVGVLTEFFRTKIAAWRTKDPVFSFSGTGAPDYDDPVKPDAAIDPFRSASFFQYLYDNKALLFHYGSEMKHSTLIHFIERKLGAVPYRYDKHFAGTVTDGPECFQIDYLFHARPKGMNLGYDWEKLARDLSRAGILYTFTDERTLLSFFDIRSMADFVLQRLREDPFYLLDAQSVAWVAPMILRQGRNLRIEDFEKEQP
jgi:aminoglycoside 3-N-acetyltransferase